MEFERSTQAKSWLFDEYSLAACRERAVLVASTGGKPKSQKFASGFYRRYRSDLPAETNTPDEHTLSFAISLSDQETLIRFHAHQIQTLVGPTAMLRELRTSATVLSTAIAFFRRFYLSNSVVEINPRMIATACAFFAAKVEEEKIDVSSS
jgi:cyclin H